MSRSTRWLLCAAFIVGSRLGATPALSIVADTLFRANGTRFNGDVTISWPSFEAADMSNVAAETMQIEISNGNLYVQLVPTTNAITPAIYTVVYTDQDGNQYTEAWAVPPSIVSLRVSDVRVVPGAITGSAPAADTSIAISAITGLQNALNIRPISGTAFAVSRAAVIDSTGAIDGAVGNLTDCLHVDGTSGACGSGTSGITGTFVDGEVPSGTVNSSNATFTLANIPNPSTSLALFRNGLLLVQGVDYTLSNSTITFASAEIPQTSDLLLANYRMSVSVPGVGFVDAEVPSGTMDGNNTSFTLSQIPYPATSVAVYRNGLRLTSGIDYTISSSSITFVASTTPQPGDTLICDYRVAQ